MAEVKKEKRLIKLHVYNTEIPINVFPDEEELYRKAAKLVSETVNMYANRYNGNIHTVNLLYMALIDIALKYEKEAKRNDTQPIKNILNKITSEIEETLKT